MMQSDCLNLLHVDLIIVMEANLLVPPAETVFTGRIRQEMDAKKIPLYIFLDLSKAFDALDHTALLSKLHYHRITNNALD